MKTNHPQGHPADDSGREPTPGVGEIKEKEPAALPAKGTLMERAESRIDQANLRTVQANTRTDEANLRTDQANSRTAEANTRTEQADLRTIKAERLSVAFRASELSYRRLFESARDGILILDADTGCITDVNPFLIELLGFSHDEMFGKTVGELSPFRDILSNQAMLERLQKDGYIRYDDLPLETRDGRNISVEFVSNVYQAGDKKVIQCNVRDVSERKRAETQLKLFRTLVDQSNDSFIVVDPETARLLDVNELGCLARGYSRAEFLALSVFDIDPMVAPDEFSKHVAQLRAKGVLVWQGLNRRKDGSTFPVEVNLKYVRLERDYIVATVRDITARKEAQAALHESERFNRATLDALGAHVAVLDENGNIIATNEAWRAFARANTQDWKAVCEGANYLTTCDDAAKADPEASQAAKGIRAVMADATKTWSHEYPCHSPTEERWFYCRVTRFPGDGPVRAVVTHENITARKRVEESHARLATAVEQSAETIVITDTDGKILYANPAFEKTSGYTRAEVLGQNPRLLKSGKQDAAFYREMWNVLARGEVWHGHFFNKRKDGTIYEEDATISPMRDAAGQIINFVAVKRDVTHELQVESQFRQLQKMEAIGTLAGGVAHDFNNMLMVISMEAGLLKSSGGLSPEQKKYADDINLTVDRAAALTRQLLLFSRREVLQPRNLDLSETVTHTTKMLRRILGEHIEVQLKLAPQPMFIHADAGMMEQVLMNLSVNARDAMPGGGQLIITTAGVELDECAATQSVQARHGAFVCLSVADTGSGIPPEVLPRIFEPFFTTKGIGQGTGLGLATVFGIVQQHQGWINVQSEVGRGTTFTVYLPRLVGMSDQINAQTMLAAIPSGKETILLVEDEPALLNMMRLTLTQLGYQVLTASTGNEALKVWKQHGPKIRLLLTDMLMPDGMTGRELAERLIQKKPRLKVIYMSGYSPDLVARDFEVQTGVNFLAKPFQARQLAQVIRDSLDKPA